MSSLKNRFKRFGLAIGVTAALAVAVAAPVGATDTLTDTTNVSTTITGGDLTTSLTTTQDLQDASASNTITAKHIDQDMSGILTLGVDDNRGSGAGWSVTVQSSAFVLSGGDGTHDIAASHFTLDTANAPTTVAGQTGTDGPTVPTASGTLDSAINVLHAAADQGMGSYTQALDVTLTVPADSRAGMYTATVTVDNSAAP